MRVFNCILMLVIMLSDASIGGISRVIPAKAGI